LKVTIGVLALCASPATLCAQATRTLTVEDSSGAAIAGATVTDSAGKPLGRTDAQGRLQITCAAPCGVHVSAESFAAQAIELTGDTTVQLAPEAAGEQVTVTAYRAPLGELESPASTRLLSQQQMQNTAAVTLDGKLRQIPGVELFRRSSSLVANPTAQGISLRGLGSTSASRTLVTMDDVPLNGPLGDWIHWDETPELAISDVEIARGGASDLYGSSAIGGVLNVRLAQPAANSLEVRSSYGAEGTFESGLLAQTKHGPWAAMLAGNLLGTDGYIQEAPWQRGPVDQPSIVHAQNGLVLVEHDSATLRLFARGSALNDFRHNGTPDQINGTKLWRYATGADWRAPHDGALTVRLYGSDERYRQTFSSISNNPTAADPGCTYRCGEVPSKFSFVPDNELGVVAHWSQPLRANLLLLAGADVRDVRVWDREQTFATNSLTNLHVHQRDSGAYVEALWTPHAWTLAASGREDWFRSYDARQLNFTSAGWTPAPTQPPSISQNVFDPRVGITRKLGGHWALSASGFRAFRAPTPSELYRSTQVGNQLTKPNGSLKSERATGWEAGVAAQRAWGTVRGSYFLTQVNRPITAVTTNPNSSPILLMRKNLGQIESKGVSLDFEMAPQRWLAVDGGYQYAHATVTSGSQDLGNWIPEVPRNMGTLNVRAFQPRWGSLSLQSRISGGQFDDDANAFLLHGYFRLDAFASRDLGRRFEVFAAGENLFDRAIEVAKTPTTTLGQPRAARFGLMLRLGEASK
jgi:outer membrane receptor protein involved in Fe transport